MRATFKLDRSIGAARRRGAAGAEGESRANLPKKTSMLALIASVLPIAAAMRLGAAPTMAVPTGKYRSALLFDCDGVIVETEVRKCVHVPCRLRGTTRRVYTERAAATCAGAAPLGVQRGIQNIRPRGWRRAGQLER